MLCKIPVDDPHCSAYHISEEREWGEYVSRKSAVKIPLNRIQGLLNELIVTQN